VRMTGPAATVFEGEWNADACAATDERDNATESGSRE